MAQRSAEELAKKQRDISIAEFFEKNRHLLGFDNPRRSLLTAIKEGVDNALDACEEARILPELNIEVIQLGETRFRLIMEDNGPGIVRAQLPKIFAKLLYGSKFHKLAQSRGQQGIGISAAVLYGQLTTGKPASITSKTDKNSPAHHVKLKINTTTNKPDVSDDKEVAWDEKEHGTRIEIDLEGSYTKGRQSVDEYIKETAIVNPHATIIYTNPEAEQLIFPRATNELPPEAKEIKPHPYGVELGRFIKMLETTTTKTLQQFLTTEFVRVGVGTAKEICRNASLLPNTKPKKFTREMAEQLLKGVKLTKIISPPTDCISPITAELLESGLRKEINAEFYCSTTRPPAVYRGNPFIIEAALAYGGEQEGDKTVRVMRFANRVPLLYQQGACAITNSIQNTAWRSYGLQQSKNSIPSGPCTIVVHMSSVWVPFTSESKEALAHYPEIIREIKRALQECGRKLASFVNKKRRIKDEGKKRSYIEKFIPHVAEALQELIGFDEINSKKIEDDLCEILEHTRGELEEIKVDNPEYDAELANIGKEPRDNKKEERDEVKEEKMEETKEKSAPEKKIEENPEDKKEDKQKTLI
ncbi:DNA topoisomerase VI subunit B [Candidatus Woesearchaeota archaeon]|jgi:DNA topoisomerase VI subunit B|nr:DNA topoisomerase VI subunit B [Candidatus Woesearchaeota archaeon]MBT5396810.1 DNA topoisomerase VI subunit B [Candidatus Woesearchaeota archaeon]MBT5924359.1 DNA topoisomerase VI subunit B [Candidatus Woesearchaeota archaeon]MBT6367698.1 DNA topoisomerase VI subunit B [Candidatus Woesearchaeota archaeon]MBT7762901.1 DNA topoisomerase VI subunit B [Candidatus Woesearchaeota archaeon]